MGEKLRPAGVPEDDVVGTQREFLDMKAKGEGRRDNVARFAQAAGEVRACPGIYEALTTDQGLDLEGLSLTAGWLPLEVLGPWDLHGGQNRSWLYGVLGRLVQTRLSEFFYPSSNIHTRGGAPTAVFVKIDPLGGEAVGKDHW